MHRREFLIATSMGAAALSIASRAQGSPRDANPVFAPAAADGAAHAVVWQPGIPAADEFARAQAERGARVFAANECMIRLWRGPLAQMLSRADVRIAGLTTYADFSIARECAREHGLRVLRESWHRDSSVALVQWFIGA
jgi:hypothetical protein